MTHPTIKKVPLPAGTLVARAFARYDYADAYSVRLPAGAPNDLDSVARVAFGSAPRWIELLLRLRDLLVAPLGLKTAPHTARRELDQLALVPGQSVGLFNVFERADDEVLLGEDDRHLDFRVSVLLRNERGAGWATISTIVHFNNWLGRAYFMAVRPFHQRIIPALIRSAYRRYR